MPTPYSQRHQQEAILYDEAWIIYDSGFRYDVWTATPNTQRNKPTTSFSRSSDVTSTFSTRFIP